jgi:hypothetical protein
MNEAFLPVPLGAGTLQPGCCHSVQRLCRPLPFLRDFGHVGVLCIFSNIPAATGLARSPQLNRSLAGQAVQHVIALQIIAPTPTSLLHLGRAGRRIVSILYGLCVYTHAPLSLHLPSPHARHCPQPPYN